MSRPKDWEPLAYSDPTPGDPYEVRQLAKRFAATAEAIQTAVTALNKIHDSSTAWESKAGREFKARTRETADTIGKAYKRYDEASGALYTYATDLEIAQDDADALLREAQNAKEGMDDAKKKDPEADTGDAEGDIEDLKRRLDPVENNWNDAGNKAAGTIEDVIGDDGLKDGFWDNFKGFVSDLTDIMGKLSAIFGVLALICSVIPFLQPFAALFGALAFITGLISLAGNIFLMANGMATLEDVLWDMVGVVSFGAGRAFSMAARGMVKAARGLAKPALIQSLRAGGKSARQAKRIARQRGITGGGREAKAAKNAYNRGEISWRPSGSDIYNSVRHPFKGVSPANFGFSDELKALPGVSNALRQSTVATATANTLGVAGNIADGHSLDVFGDLPVIGSDPSPVERNQ